MTSNAVVLGIILALNLAVPASAQLPPGVFAGEADYRTASAGRYVLDPDHTAVVAKVSHIGYAYSVFRFEKVDGTLNWKPDSPEASSLTVRVQTASITSPVAGFAKTLSGSSYLNSSAYPTATFVSTAFHKTDDRHGQVEGQFTLLGKSHPLTFDVDLGGAGKGFMGHPRIGVEARAQINPQDFGLPAMFNMPIILQIDAEFAEQP